MRRKTRKTCFEYLDVNKSSCLESFVTCVSMTAVVSAQVQLQPLNAAVLRGSKARFNCSTTQPPSVMNWMVNGRLVITILQASEVWNSTDRFSATNFTTPGDYRWEFVISNVQRDDAGEVTCQVLGGAPRMATMSVQGEQCLKFYHDSFQLINAT